MIRILIADDHMLIREGLKKIIDKEIDISIIGEAKNGAEIMDFLAKKPFDVLVLDISLPDRDGLDVLKEIKILNPSISVLILSMHPEDRFAVRALRAGASGYITKESASDELVNAIRKVTTGGKYVSRQLAEKLAFDLDWNTDKELHERLSNREFQILLLLGSGKTVKEISDNLCISSSTVNTYRTRILEKMGMHSNVQLIHYVIRNKLID